jgi:predicted Zn-ribbon and HTH transcriptional regulator
VVSPLLGNCDAVSPFSQIDAPCRSILDDVSNNFRCEFARRDSNGEKDVRKMTIDTLYQHMMLYSHLKSMKLVQQNSNTLLATQYPCRKCEFLSKSQLMSNPNSNPTCPIISDPLRFGTLRCTSTHQATMTYEDTLPRSYTSPYHRSYTFPARSIRCTPSARSCVATMV